MVRITEDLVRKKAEHNNCELSTLEEVSLHQLDIERIEILDKVCRELKILYLQSNLIPKIENTGRLKKLEYLNLALNNVTKIENLAGCESLQKLDLTVNFIGELSSIETLKDNYNLRELFLTGNPCTQFNGYREYVVTTLPQLQHLDGREIEKSEKILAKQVYENIKESISQQEKEYAQELEKKKYEKNTTEDTRKDPGFDGRWYTDMDAHLTEDKKTEKERKQKEDDETRFWQEQVDYTPESRLDIHRHMEEKRKEREEAGKRTEKVKKEVRYFAKDGRPLNINQGKFDFVFTDDEDNNVFVLDLSCPKYLDTSLIDTDLQPTYVRITVKGQIMQLALQEEINPDSSTAKRSQVTGHLLITMPKIKEIVKPKKTIENQQQIKISSNQTNSSCPTKLEVDPSVLKKVDFGNIMKEKPKKVYRKTEENQTTVAQPQINDEDFVDDPDVPALI